MDNQTQLDNLQRKFEDHRHTGTDSQKIVAADLGLDIPPADASYVVGTANSSLSAEQSLGALTTGLLKNTVSGSTGTLSTAVSNTDYAAAAHATRHESGGADAIKLDNLAAPDDNTDLNASTSAHGLLKKLSNVSTEFLNGQGNFATPSTGMDNYGEAGASVNNTTTETTVFTESIPGGTLSTNKAVSGTLYINTFKANSANNTFRLQLKYGNQTLYDETFGGAGDPLDTTSESGTIQFALRATGATGTQACHVYLFTAREANEIGANANYMSRYGAGAGTVDSTANQTFEITVEWAGGGDALTNASFETAGGQIIF